MTDCVACTEAIAESLRWARGDPIHARDVMAIQFVDAHVQREPNGPDKELLATARGYLHLAQYYRRILETLEAKGGKA
ncbi:MAG TPA: hypothetical protein VGG32_10520 [Thermoplasmata archaeon]|jgi:hypothetical protein